MSTDAPAPARRGLIVPHWLFLIFVTLKLTGTGIVAEWSWWWVTSPLWIFALLVMLGAVLAKLAE